MVVASDTIGVWACTPWTSGDSQFESESRHRFAWFFDSGEGICVVVFVAGRLYTVVSFL